MNLQEIEEIRTIANQISEKLTPHPSSILKNQFNQFCQEIDRTLFELVVKAYKNGELKTVESEERKQP